MRQPNLSTLPTPHPLRERPRSRTARRLAVLTFRDIDDPSAFRAQAERLLRTANPVSLIQFQDALLGAPLPPHAVLVTFEHGYRSTVTEALPVLSARSIPAVAFVVAGLVDTERPYWWQEAEFLVRHGGRGRDLPLRTPGGAVAALAAMPDPDRRRCLEELRVTARRPMPGRAQLTGADLSALRNGSVEIGNHSYSHARLDRCDDYTVREEIIRAHTRLTVLSGAEPSAFAHPGGVPDPRAEALLRGYGYRSAFLSDGLPFDLRPSTPVTEARPGLRTSPDPLRISRLNVDAGTSRGLFDGVLAGWNPTVRRLRGAAAV